MYCMGFFNWFKKKEEITETEPEKERIKLKEVLGWIKNKEKEAQLKNQEVFDLIQEKIELFIDETQKKLEILENVDVDSKKAEDRLKLIVKENLENYVYYVRDFLRKLEGLEIDTIERFLKKVDYLLMELDKRSNLSYQKVTILVGKEMAVIKEEIKNFSKFLIDIFNEKKGELESLKKIDFVRSRYDQFIKLDESIDKIDEEMGFLEIKIGKEREEEQKIFEQIDKVKGTPEYAENEKRLRRIEAKEDNLGGEILKLKRTVDFKALGNIFHVDRKKMEILNYYKENFQAEFQKENGENLLKLIEESGLNSDDFLEQMNKVRILKKEIVKEKYGMKENKVQELYSKKNKIGYNIMSLTNEKIDEERKKDKLEYSRLGMLNSLKRDLESQGAVLQE